MWPIIWKDTLRVPLMTNLRFQLLFKNKSQILRWQFVCEIWRDTLEDIAKNAIFVLIIFIIFCQFILPVSIQTMLILRYLFIWWVNYIVYVSSIWKYRFCYGDTTAMAGLNKCICILVAVTCVTNVNLRNVHLDHLSFILCTFTSVDLNIIPMWYFLYFV